MILRTRAEHPADKTMHFAVSGGIYVQPTWWNDQTPVKQNNMGFVGIVWFEGGKWYQMPNMTPMSDNNIFYWVDQS